VTAARVDEIGPQLLPQAVDVDLDYIAVLVAVVFVDVLAQLRFGKHPTRMQHEATQQPELYAGEIDAATVQAHASARLLVEGNTGDAERSGDRPMAALQQGTNAIGLVLGNGFFNQSVPTDWGYEKAPWRATPRALVQAHVTFTDGTSQTVVSEGELRAPADAIVVHRFVEPGQLVAPGQPGLTLAFTDRLYVRTYVPEPSLGKVRIGLAAEVVVDAFKDKTFKAKVAEVAREAEFTPKQVETRTERVNLVYAAKVDLDGGWDAPLVPGQPAEVLIRTGATP